MPALPIIKRVVSLKRLGVFRDYTVGADLPHLRQHNLIYGFNGSGKTTLSRVFASLEAGALRPQLPEGGTFEIELSDGNAIKNTAALDQLKGRLLVFNVDFVEENLRWKEGTANPVFYLGKEQTELAAKLEETDSKLRMSMQRLTNASADLKHKEDASAEYKRSTARFISQQLGLGRSYIATNLDTDYADTTYDVKHKLPEAEVQQLRSIITQDAPLAKRARLDAKPLGFSEQLREVKNILDTTLGTMAVADLRDHEAMLRWVKEGLDYHQTHDLDACLFCGHELTEARKRALGAAIDDKFDKLTGDVATARRKAEELRSRFDALKISVPSSNDIAKDLQASFAVAAADLQKSIASGIDALNSVLSLLERKAATPNVRVDGVDLMSESDASIWEVTAIGRLEKLNAVIDNHNASHDSFSEVQEAARTKIKAHLLADAQAQYTQVTTDETSAITARDSANAEHDALAKQAEAIRSAMRQHGPAADLINRMIRNYLGHPELEIGTLNEGYQLRRNGRPVSGSLSEGEKTAIAICYFLSVLEAEGRKPKELIVVVDDPISSLDSRALNYAFSIIKAALSDAGQLIILTHNLHFMNEAKKWLKMKTEKEVGPEKATSTLLFLDAIQKNAGDARSASIKVLPKHIREYESEYQYLFHLMLQFSQSPDGDTGYFYVMPNALRKVMEIFLAFKDPGSAGLSSKVEALAKGGHGLDPGRIRALDRLVQVESHADNLDDLVAFSSMTLEETRDAASALMTLMETLDKGHYDSMSRICRA